MKTIIERDDGVSVLLLETPEDGELWRVPFVGAYQAIWSEPPYNERFFPDEAEGVLRRALRVPDNITLLAVRPSGVCVGFGVAYPVLSKSDVAREIRGLLPPEDTFYLAELGVLDGWRDRGLGHQLVEHRLNRIDRQRYRYALLRTSAVRNASYEMYRRMGFDDTGVYMEVSSRRVDGSTRTDRRLFLSIVL
jgi:ribosomal protein S18 acetylase RimI-like enzyme